MLNFSEFPLTMDALIYGSFFGLSVAAAGLNFMARKTSDARKSVSNPQFTSFQRTFFFSYFLALLGDWLQGPYVYRLYDYYGFKESQIAVLYVAGFASSVTFGTATGPLADMIGRKKMSLTFCVLYTICCLTKLSSDYFVLMLGRFFGGISTSMLFSSFESWYVYEHTQKYGFPSEWMAVTFSTTTFFNGLLAIIAGVAANFSAEALGYGPVAPFVLAIFPLVISGIFISATWNENYGQQQSNSRFFANCGSGFELILRNPNIFFLGCVQTAVESGMYIFVFLWTPVLMPAHPPLGMVFACFMVAIMMGSSIYTLMLARGYKAEELLRICLMTLASSFLVCCFTAKPQPDSFDTIVTYAAFLVLELAIGIYFPAISYCKSQVIPESHRANVMNWFRVPMNVITCTVLLLLNVEEISKDKRIVFAGCFVMVCFGILTANKLIESLKKSAKGTQNGSSTNNQPAEEQSSLLENQEL